MANYAYTPTSFAGTTLTSVCTNSYFMFDNGPLKTAPRSAVEAAIPGLGDRDVRGQAMGQTWRLHCNLKDLTEATQKAFLQCFSEESGQQTLIATDGSAASWKVSARVLGLEWRNAVQVDVILRVADPRWQENTATTATSGTSTASTISPTITNNGNRQARAQYTITAIAAKTGVALDFGGSLQGFIVNRSPNDIVRKPCALFDVSGAASRIDMSAIGLASGDDLRVWLDDVPDIPRWIANVHAASCEVWINIDLPAAIGLTTTTAIASGVSPANGASITFNEDISRLPQKGFLAFIKEGANNDEIIYFASRAGRTVYGIQRGLWGTTASAHAVGSTSAPACFANPRHYVVATKNSGVLTQTLYGPPPAYASQRPAIQLVGSSNQTWKWGDQADDASTIYFDRTAPDRTAQWVPGFDLDGNTISPVMSLVQSDTIITFNDEVPGDGSPPVNFLEVSVPQGIQKLTTSITNDWTPAAEIINLELWTRDAGGVLKLADQLQSPTAAPARQTTPSTTIYGVKLKGRYNIITGFEGQDGTNALVISNASASSIADGVIAVKFTFTGDRRPKKVQARLQKTTAGTQAVTCYVVADASGSPGSLIGSLGNGSPTPSNTAATIEWTMPPQGFTKGTSYWLVFWTPSTFASVNFKGYTGTNFSDHLPVYQRTAGAWVFQTSIGLWVSITGGYDNSGNALIESDNPVTFDTGARTNTHASFDKSVLTLATAQSIYVHRTGTFGTTLYHCQDLITNTTTGDTAQLDTWMALNATIVIDTDARTVVKTEASVAYPVTKICTFSNSADWLPLNAGANAITVVDAGRSGVGSISFDSSVRGTKV